MTSAHAAPDAARARFNHQNGGNCGACASTKPLGERVVQAWIIYIRLRLLRADGERKSR